MSKRAKTPSGIENALQHWSTKIQIQQVKPPNSFPIQPTPGPPPQQKQMKLLKDSKRLLPLSSPAPKQLLRIPSPRHSYDFCRGVKRGVVRRGSNAQDIFQGATAQGCRQLQQSFNKTRSKVTSNQMFPLLYTNK